MESHVERKFNLRLGFRSPHALRAFHLMPVVAVTSKRFKRFQVPGHAGFYVETGINSHMLDMAKASHFRDKVRYRKTLSGERVISHAKQVKLAQIGYKLKHKCFTLDCFRACSSLNALQ